MCLLLKQVIDPGLVTLLLALAFVFPRSSQEWFWLNYLTFTIVWKTVSYLETGVQAHSWHLCTLTALNGSLAHPQ